MKSIDEEVNAFVDAITSPKLTRIEGIPLEADVDFRSRILSVCAKRDAPLIEVAIGGRLDAIGYLHGLVRKGLSL